MRTAPITLISAGQMQHTLPYERSVQAAGGVAVVRRPADGLDAYLAVAPDAVVLAGGASIDPSHYGADYEAGVAFDPEPARDALELALLRHRATTTLPVLGICRGLQMVNVASGGTLWQHLPLHGHPDAHAPDVPRDQLVHGVRADSGVLASLLGTERFVVNSIHDQAVRRLAPGFRATVHTDDGHVVEGIESLDGRILAVQWHPEELAATHAQSRSLFTDLVRRAATRGDQRRSA
ncbi:hypothetical protein GCM10009846_27950 [Agrococcus versicolor]|uniref:Gamma-glutamyl-gamma-aminobutyrate hydrolase family protein n=1 Tax=Agrococcus versicolor TaxID=501482 RepID=A0ABP5MMZ4_9MICO